MALSPGFYRDVPRSVYDSWGAINFSRLEPFSRSAAHAREYMTNPPEPNAQMVIGQAVHVAVLEPALFESLYVSAPDDAPERRSKADKAWWAAFEAAAGERTVLKPDEYKRVLLIRDAVWAKPRAAQILSGEANARECSIVWTDETTGELCKARLDLLSGYLGGALIDLKTTRDASAWKFGRDAAAFDYPGQLAFYRDGLNALVPRDRPVFIIAIEQEPPFASAIYELDGDVLSEGRRRYRKYLDTFAECKRSGVWPSYPDAMLRVPAYYYREGLE